MTTTTTAEQLGAARRNRLLRRGTQDPTVDALRAESTEALTRLVRALGYPPHWADELERRAFAAGRVWSFSATES